MTIVPAAIFAGGISVDAGLTPPQDRIIFRAQYRYMSMGSRMMDVNSHMTPLVVAYGITPGISVMGRGAYVQREFSNSNLVRRGLNDPFLLTKFRLYRKNTADFVFGVSTHIASNIPVGSDEVSNGTWNPEAGINISYRPRFFAVDVNTAYVFSDLSNNVEFSAGDLFKLNAAFSAHIPFRKLPSTAVSPVVEVNYLHQWQNENSDLPSSDLLMVSPGVSFIYSSLALEALVQIPVYQTNDENLMQQDPGLILGVKYML